MSSKSQQEAQLELLDKEIEDAKSSFKTQKLSMSIGELCSLFKKKDLILNPNFQRVFRWDITQRSRLIESILLGIPLPPIFIAQQKNGKWTVVDGLQRLSTIFSLEGLLESDQKDSIKQILSKKHEILVENEDDDEFLDIETEIEDILHEQGDMEEKVFHFHGLKKLQHLNGLTWKGLSLDHRRTVRRSFFEINIMYLENNTKAQYELFQRLNTGGSSLTPQEVRNCIIIMNNIDFFNAMDTYRLDDSFIKITNLSIKQMQEAYDMELINRFIIALNYENIDFSKYSNETKIGDFIDDETLDIIEKDTININNSINLLKLSIDRLEKCLGKDSFRRYNPKTGKFYGSFNLSAFEAVLIGVARNIDSINTIPDTELIGKIKGIYTNSVYIKASSRGTKVINRFDNLTKFSLEYFK